MSTQWRESMNLEKYYGQWDVYTRIGLEMFNIQRVQGRGDQAHQAHEEERHL